MLKTMKVKEDNMYAAAQRGFINATDLADYLVRKGLPFREAYKISGAIVSHCIANGQVLETLPLAEYQNFSDVFAEDLYDAIDLRNAVNRRSSKGGTSAASVEEQCRWLDGQLAVRKGNQ